MQARPEYRHSKDANNNMVHASVNHQYMNIRFKSLGSPGVEVLDVVEALVYHTEYKQKTRQGSNEDAQVLFKLHEALDILKGTKTMGSVESMLPRGGAQ